MMGGKNSSGNAQASWDTIHMKIQQIMCVTENSVQSRLQYAQAELLDAHCVTCNAVGYDISVVQVGIHTMWKDDFCF